MTDIAEIRRLAIKAIVPKLPELDDAQLADLQATEAADDNPRESLLAAIDAELQRRAAAPGAAQGTPDGPPAWQAQDYAGPLTGEQAVWRNANITRL